MLQTYSLEVGGGRTAVRLEPELMASFREIAEACGLSVDQLATEVAGDRHAAAGLSSALRVFVVGYYRHEVASGARDARPRRAEPPARTSARDYMVATPISAAGDAAPELVKLVQWWDDRRSRLGVPSIDDIDPRLVRDLGLLGLVHLIDARTGDPADFQIRLWGRRVRIEAGRDLTGYRFRDLPGRAYRDAAVSDYSMVAAVGLPQIKRVEASVDGRIRVYQRATVPLVGRGGRVDQLLAALSYAQPGPSAPDEDDLGLDRLGKAITGDRG